MKDKNMNKDIWQAPKYFMYFVFFFMLLIIIALVYVSLFKNVYGTNMKEFASTRNTYSTTLYAKRGTIYDSEGNSLALNVSSYTVIAYLSETRTGSSTTPKHVVNVEETAEKLSPLLNMTKEKLVELLSKKLYQVELGPGGRGITELTKKEIESLNLPGIDFVETYKRFYPNGDFASYILGYAKNKEIELDNGTTTTDIVGELGLESKYNKMLTGTNGYLSYQRDRYGYKIPDTEEFRVEAINGNNIYLTIDSNIQRFTESAMKDVQSNYGPQWGVLTVLNAKTGELLAASSIPSFDPNIKNISNYQSPYVTFTYEPGSVMKIFSYLCSIDSGKYDGNMAIKSGSIKIGDDEVRDWNRVGWGYITLDKGFVYSSNVAASTLVQQVITKSELRECLENYGFGTPTGIELSNESSGDITFTYPIEVATASFGQGITVTALQILQGLTVIANNGYLVKPRVVNKIVNPNTNEIVYESKLTKSDRVAKQESIEKIRSLMYEVVNSDDPNAGGRYRANNTVLIGKTGTAQIASSHGYLTGATDYTYSFAGIFPYEDPQIIVYAAIQKPVWGGSVALTAAIREVTDNITKYLNLNGTEIKESQIKSYTIDSYVGKNTEDIKSKLSIEGINPIILGTGDKIVKQYPKEKTCILNTDKVVLLTNSEYTMPNLTGLSRKDAISILKLLNVQYKIEGTGFVKEQSIPIDTPLTAGIEVQLLLTNKYNLEEVN